MWLCDGTVARWFRQVMGALLRHPTLFGETPMVPKHVAFIMDGNRRFAKRQRIATAGGHSRGFDKVDLFHTIRVTLNAWGR